MPHRESSSATAGSGKRQDEAGKVGRIGASSVSSVSNRDLLEVVCNNATVALFIMDERQCCVYMNPAAEQLTGFTLAQVSGRPLHDVIHHTRPDGSRYPLEECPIDRVFPENNQEQGEEVFVHKSGRFYSVAFTASPVRDETGRVVGTVIEVQDITERKRKEEERARLLDSERAARGEAERANRMKDEFLATLSHELRTPLNAILGWTQLLRRGQARGEDMQQGLETIERNARAQTRLIDDLLDMSRIISGKLRIEVQRTDVASVIDAAVESIMPAAQARAIRVRKVLDTHAGPVRADPNRLQQVVWNLLSNAIKFTPKGGSVQVALERVDSHIEITVTDTGVGIAPEFLPHVFERFRQAEGTTTRSYAGLGLGLAITKSIVEMHGGIVRAKSPGVGKGATFSVEIPLMVLHGDAEDFEGRQHPRRQSLGGEADDLGYDERLLEGVTVLVVDDEPDARDLIRRVLESVAAEVLLAADAGEAFELLRRERPDVLVSDIGMPGEDGYSLIGRVRELAASEGADIPAAALTAFARSEDRRRALMAGYQSHLAKPVEPAELVTVVASLAGKIRRRRA